METCILNFPEEIMSDILRRLAVGLLWSCKSVCKQWYFLISNKYFATENLCATSTKVYLTIDDASNTSDEPSNTLKYCSLNSLLSEANLNPDEFQFPVKNYEDIQIVGCCKGLRCILVDGSCFYLWNPSTRMSKMLPDVIGSDSGRFAIWRYGFGYDESHEDYKFCVLFQHRNFRGLKYMRVFSMRYGYWKHIKIPSWEEINIYGAYRYVEDEVVPLMRRSGKLLKGKLHWGIEYLKTIPKIVSFDLTSETWKHVKLPLYFGGKFSNTVGIIAGRLCILCNISKRRGDIWIMKEYGVIQSWERVFKIPYDHHDCKGPYLTPPLCILPDCRIILLRGSLLTIYDPKDKSLQEITCFGNIVDAETYIEDSTQKLDAQEDEMGAQSNQFIPTDLKDKILKSSHSLVLVSYLMRIEISNHAYLGELLPLLQEFQLKVLIYSGLLILMIKYAFSSLQLNNNIQEKFHALQFGPKFLWKL